MVATRVTQHADKVVRALKVALEQPGTGKNREAAEAIIQLRRQFRYKGIPDWAGRSPEYRDCIERVYREAGVPSDSGNNFQANLRYHLGNALRKAAPPDELESLGLAAQGPLGRVRDARQENRQAPRPRAKVIGDPVAMADAALGIVKAMKTMQLAGTAAVLEPRLRALIDETLNVITELHA